ncbi:MAG: ArnT family glycosyltransferase, partial [Prolixibacteraceae bacterium]
VTHHQVLVEVGREAVSPGTTDGHIPVRSGKDGVVTTLEQADGTPRFIKPILTYWVVMGSYKLFGISVFSSRLFFWLAGALLVTVTFFMAKSLTGNHKLAMIAGFITAANPLVLMSAGRSIPDILLVLFLTVSAWSFLKIMTTDKPAKKHYWFAYLGAALAFETKGLPAAAFAGASMLFLVLNPWKRKKIKQILEPFSITTAVFIALSWFVIMYVEHGTEYLSSFYTDQVGDRVSSKIGQAVTNLFLGILNLIAFLIPWVLIAFSRPRKLKLWYKNADSGTKAIAGFVMLWVVLIIAMSGAVFKFYDRYLLPVIPVVSLLFAFVFVHTETKGKKTAFRVFFSLNIFVITISMLYAIFILPDTILIPGIITALIFLLVWLSGRLKKLPEEILIANAVLLLFFNIFILLHPLLMPNPGEQLVKNLNQAGAGAAEKIYVYGNIRTASNIRIQSHNKLNVVSMDTVYALPKGTNHFLVFNQKEKSRLNLSDYKIMEGSEEWKRVPVEAFPAFLQKPVNKLKENGTKYFIAKPVKQ